MDKQEVVLVCGYPASGKSSFVERNLNNGYVRLNRDTCGGKVADLLPKLDLQLAAGRSVVLDNLFATKESRKPFIDLATKKGVLIRCCNMATTIEDAMFNACRRMYAKYGKVLTPEECSQIKNDPNSFPIAVLYKFRKEYEKPSVSEGFSGVETVPFTRQLGSGYSNKALILDFDGCLRETKSGSKWPTDVNDVRTKPNCKEVLATMKEAGYRLLGASNQSAIAKGELTVAVAEACFAVTNRLLDQNIEIAYCPHKVPPITCYCRKPGPAIGVQWIEKYKLDPKQCVMIGDMKTDNTFADRCGFRFCDADAFFGGKWKNYL